MRDSFEMSQSKKINTLFQIEFDVYLFILI